MVSQQLASIQSNDNNKVYPPGPPSLPFVNALPFVGNKLHIELNQLAKKYGNIFQIRVGSRTFVVLNSLEVIRQALVKQADSFNGRADFWLYRQPPQGNFMEAKSGEAWKKHRSLVVEVMHTCIAGKSDMIENWVLEEAADLANIFANSDGQPFDPISYIPRACLSFIQRLIFSKKGSINDPNEDPDFLKIASCTGTVNKGGTILSKLQHIPPIWRPIVFLYYSKSILNFVRLAPVVIGYLNKNVEQHKKSLDPENLRNITDGLLQATSKLTESDRNNLGLSEKDIVNGTLDQFLGAGIELPNVMVRWALLYAINYPDIQAEIQKELDQVVGREQQPRLEHRGKLPFTAAFLNEVARHTSATTLSAFTYRTNTDVSLNGYFIPKNTPLLVNYYSLSRDERHWENPEEFNPYRFLDKNGNLRNDLTEKYYLFGVGSRRCLGEYLGRLLIFLYFTNIIHKCKVEKVPGEKASLEPQPVIFLSPQKYKIIAKPRF